jgi:adenylate cyclase
MLELYYLPEERRIEAGQAFTVLDASLEAGIPHTHVCGGNARCSTCRVIILEGQEHCAARTPAEEKLANHLHLDPAVRLACQTELVGNGTVKLRRLCLDTDDLTVFFDEATGRIAPRMMGKEQTVAILFADIRGFTALSESLLPYDVIYVLNRYFQRMSRAISRYGGTINAYMGDGLMALFGVDNPDHAVESAIRAGVEMLEAVETLNPSLELLYHQKLRIGIGVHYGCTVIGTIGDPNNPKMTAIGDAVNLASRIESANKPLDTSFLISEEAYQAVGDQVIVDRKFQVKIPGKRGEYCLHEVVGIAAPSMDFESERSQLVSPLDVLTPLKQWLRTAGRAIQFGLGRR